MPLGENVKQVLYSFKYACLYCLLSAASGRFAEFYAENSGIDRLFDIHYWGDLFAHTLLPKLLWDFFIDTLNVLLFSPWGFIIFLSVYTLPTWGTALVTFLDESGLQFIGDAIEFFIVSQSYQNRRDPEDYSDLPELVGDNGENCDGQSDSIHIVDEQVYHPVYGVMSKSILIQWGEWPVPTAD